MVTNLILAFEIWTAIVVFSLLYLLIKEGSRVTYDLYRIFFGRNIFYFFFSIFIVYVLSPLAILLKIVELLSYCLTKLSDVLRYLNIQIFINSYKTNNHDKG